MNILLVTGLYPSYQNQSRRQISYALHYFSKEWAKAGHNVLVIRPWSYFPGIFNFLPKARRKRKCATLQQFVLDGIKIMRYPVSRFPKRYCSFRTTKRAGKDIGDIVESMGFEPNIIICHMINPSFFISLELARSFAKPLVLGMHNTDIMYLRKERNRRAFRSFLPMIDGIAFRSRIIKKEFLGYFPNSAPKVQFVASSGIEERYILSFGEGLAKAKRAPASIMIAAHLIPLKNVNILIEAFAMLGNPNISLYIIGDGPERSRLEKLTRMLEVNTQVYFVGEKGREEVLEHMADSNIFAMVSSPETFGLVYVEAMAKGCITIGTVGEGIDGVIKHGFNGFLCKPGDVQELARILEDVLALDLQQKERIIINAICTAQELTQSNVARSYLDPLQPLFKTGK